MRKHSSLSRLRPLTFVMILSLGALFTSCLSDTLTGPEVKPRLVGNPASARFYATNFQAPLTGDMVVLWNHSPSDTQQNFKSYLVRVYASDTAGASNPDNILALVDSGEVYKVGSRVDTSFVVHNVKLGRYTVMVNGEQFSDTLKLSTDTTIGSNWFDPRPVNGPTNVMATSLGPNNVGLTWTLPGTDTNQGFEEYVIYFRDTWPKSNGTKDSAHVAMTVSRGGTLANVALPLIQSSQNQNPQQEHEYEFWVKAMRYDSVQATDSSIIEWAGAVRGPTVEDTAGFTHPVYIGSANGIQDVIQDSVDNGGQFSFSVSNGIVTLNAQNGASFMSRIDDADALDSIYYAKPNDDSMAFINSSLTLPATSSKAGIIVYLQWIDPLIHKPEFARIWIRKQPDGSFVTAKGGIYITASFQPGVTKSGDKHIVYY